MIDILARIARAFDAAIDITPDADTLAMLEQPACCDKHRELVDAAAIARLQERIVANGGTVRIVEPQEHAARLKERRP